MTEYTSPPPTGVGGYPPPPPPPLPVQPTKRKLTWLPWALLPVALTVGVSIGSTGSSEADVDPIAIETEVETDEAETEKTTEAVEEIETEEEGPADTVSDGVWTVGLDIKPGTYRTTGVGSDCYWAILVSGTNGSDIVENDIPGGGNPTVTVEEGQDFETARCGEWVLQ